MTPSEATAAKLTALQEIAQDNTLASCDMRLAVLLLTEYFSAQHGYAWPSRKRLAEELGVAESTVTRALERLEEGGHFAVVRSKGRGHTNQYYPVFTSEKGAPTRPINDGSVDAHKRERPRTEKGAPTRPYSLLEPIEEESSVAKATSPKKGNSHDPKRGTRIPVDWQPSAEGRQFAQALELSPEQNAPQFVDHFRQKPGKDGLSLDWDARYRTWCRNEAKWTAERLRNRPANGGVVAATRASLAEGERMEGLER